MGVMTLLGCRKSFTQASGKKKETFIHLCTNPWPAHLPCLPCPGLSSSHVPRTYVDNWHFLDLVCLFVQYEYAGKGPEKRPRTSGALVPRTEKRGLLKQGLVVVRLRALARWLASRAMLLPRLLFVTGCSLLASGAAAAWLPCTGLRASASRARVSRVRMQVGSGDSLDGWGGSSDGGTFFTALDACEDGISPQGAVPPGDDLIERDLRRLFDMESGGESLDEHSEFDELRVSWRTHGRARVPVHHRLASHVRARSLLVRSSCSSCARSSATQTSREYLRTLASRGRRCDGRIPAVLYPARTRAGRTSGPRTRPVAAARLAASSHRSRPTTRIA